MQSATRTRVHRDHTIGVDHIFTAEVTQRVAHMGTTHTASLPEVGRRHHQVKE